MIAAALFAQSVLQVSFSPPLVFAGEPFQINAPAGVEINAITNLRKQGGFWAAQRPQATEIWSLERGGNDLRDAAKIQVPISLVPRWQSWPIASGARGGAWFLIGKERNLALVPVSGGYGLCASSGGLQRRWGNVLQLNIAVRSGPRHERAITADYVYAGKDHITLMARPDRVARLVMSINKNAVEVAVLAEYQMIGTISLLGDTKQISLSRGEKTSLSVRF